MDFHARLSRAVARYRSEVAGPREHLSLLRWQMAEGHALDRRDTFPGHLTTSAFVLSPDHAQILLIDHVVIGRWLQPGGHWEEAEHFHLSAAREAEEETSVQGLSLHPWHAGGDVPFTIDSHDVRQARARRAGSYPSRSAIPLPGRSCLAIGCPGGGGTCRGLETRRGTGGDRAARAGPHRDAVPARLIVAATQHVTL